MDLSPRDILARTIEAEAGNQGALGMMSVGSVIMNRLKNPAYASDLHSVILQPGQFSVWNKATGYAGGNQGRNMDSVIPSETAFMVTDQLLDQNYNDPTGGATHFYNSSISNPSWGKQAGGNWMDIGDHVFGVPAETRKNDMNVENLTNTSSPLLMPKPKQQQQTNQPKGLFSLIGGAVGNGFSGLKDAITGDDADKSDRLAIALMSLSGNPNQLRPLMEMAANDIKTRADQKLLDKGKNNTIEFLTKRMEAGDTNAGTALQLVESVGAGEALKSYMTANNNNPSDKTAANTKTYENGTMVMAFQGGGRKVLDPNGVEVKGKDAAKVIAEANAYEVEQARLTKLAEANATNQASLVSNTIKSIDSTVSSLRNYGRAKAMVKRAIANGDNVTGLVEDLFPNVSVVAAELENARNALALDVIGSVTFGALSKGELQLAQTQGLPLQLEEKQLLEFIERRELALNKMKVSLVEAARFLSKDGNTIEMYVDQILGKQEQVENPYKGKSDDELETLYVEVMSGNSTLAPARRQRIIDEAERRAGL